MSESIERCGVCGGDLGLAVAGSPGDMLLQCLCPRCLGVGFIELEAVPIGVREDVRDGVDGVIERRGLQRRAHGGVSVLSRGGGDAALQRGARERDPAAGLLLPLWWDW